MQLQTRCLHLALPLSAVMLASCASPSFQDAHKVSLEATAQTYAANRTTKGIVLLDINWGRRWNCSGFENAQLVSLSFDRAPLKQLPNEAAADVTLDGPSRLTAQPVFSSYALLLTPGEYALSNAKIKLAKSSSDVGYWTAQRSDLIKEGSPLGGSFSVAAGETVYIGNFGLDCYKQPLPWRYYTEGQHFKSHIAQYVAKYPFIDPNAVSYRLFETKELGRPYAPK